MSFTYQFQEKADRFNAVSQHMGEVKLSLNWVSDEPVDIDHVRNAR